MSWADQLAVRAENDSEMSEQDRHELVLCLARATREAGRLRSAIFAGDPLGNATWDVMLDLFIQEMNGFRTSLDQLSINGEMLAATVYACVEVLDGIGLLERTPDRFDNRVTWLSLTVRGRQGLFGMFNRLAEIVQPGPGRIADEPHEVIA
jgi:hypothetical protein